MNFETSSSGAMNRREVHPEALDQITFSEYKQMLDKIRSSDAPQDERLKELFVLIDKCAVTDSFGYKHADVDDLKMAIKGILEDAKSDVGLAQRQLPILSRIVYLPWVVASIAGIEYVSPWKTNVATPTVEDVPAIPVVAEEKSASEVEESSDFEISLSILKDRIASFKEKGSFDDLYTVLDVYRDVIASLPENDIGRGETILSKFSEERVDIEKQLLKIKTGDSEAAEIKESLLGVFENRSYFSELGLGRAIQAIVMRELVNINDAQG